MSNKNANIGARLDRLPNSGWHIKMCIRIRIISMLVKWYRWSSTERTFK